MLKVLMAAAGVFLFVSLPAHAGFLRTWVSTSGQDVPNCGPLDGTPCRTLQFAYYWTVESGEIGILDPGEYGPLTITKPISIVGNGSLDTLLQFPSGDAITIGSPNPSIYGSAPVTFRGVTIDGMGTGSNGIRILSGVEGVVIDNCIIRNFAVDTNNPVSGNGVAITPSIAGRVTIINSSLSGNRFSGIYFLGTNTQSGESSLTVHGVRLVDNNIGMLSAGNADPGTQLTASISNTVVSSGVFGFNFDHTIAYFDKTDVSQNDTGGKFSNSTVRIGASNFTGNSVADLDFSSTVSSAGNNRIGVVSGGGTLTPVGLQ